MVLTTLACCTPKTPHGGVWREKQRNSGACWLAGGSREGITYKWLREEERRTGLFGRAPRTDSRDTMPAGREISPCLCF